LSPGSRDLCRRGERAAQPLHRAQHRDRHARRDLHQRRRPGGRRRRPRPTEHDASFVRDAVSPTIDVLGSYFPAWMVCTFLGLAATIVARQILVGLRLDAHLRPAGLVYVCMMVLWTMTAWLLFFNA